jgi:putative transposase
MKFYENTYYHIYNRTNNEEALFRSRDNYLYFLKKYRYYLEDFFETIGYCLMPTHFHFLVRVREFDQPSEGEETFGRVRNGRKPSEGSQPSEGSNSLLISKRIGTLLNSYSQAFNKMWNRHGNLFNQKTKAKPVASDCYLITLLAYIHQNPVRSGLVSNAAEWEFSSYQDYIDMRSGTLPSKNMILSMIRKEELKEMTEGKMIYVD